MPKQAFRPQFKLAVIIGLLLVILSVAGAILWQRHADQPAREEVTVAFLDVGQGDAIYIRTPSGFDILIDGGPDNRVIEQLGPHMPFVDRDIDLMISTHPDADHITGLVEVFDRFTVDRVWWSGVEGSTAVGRAWMERLEKEDALVETVTAGKQLRLSDGTSIQVLYPLERPDPVPENINNTSVSVKISFGESDVILTGDLEADAEARLTTALADTLDAEILKAGHHGSRTSTTEPLLEAASPEVVVLSVGRENKFGHPHRETLERIKESGASVVRTDCSGTIIVTLYPTSYSIESDSNAFGCDQEKP